jgi:hypothetical protein
MLLIRIVSIWTYGENGLSPIENKKIRRVLETF